MSKKHSGAFILGMLVGGVVGAATGIIVAPRSGRRTRRLLKKSAQALPELAEDISSSVQMQAGRLSETAMRNWDETLGRLKEAIAAGMEASQRARNISEREEVLEREETSEREETTAAEKSEIQK